MTVFLCRACGTSYPDAEAPPARCPICDDERQYVPTAGQAWTTGAALAAGHRNAWQQLEPGLTQPADGAGLRHQPARLPGDDAGGEPALGLRRTPRRRDRGDRARPRRRGGDRDVAPALLHDRAGLGRRLRRAGAPARRRPELDRPAGPGDPALGRRQPAGAARRHAGPARRPLPRRHGRALGGRRGGRRRDPRRRHPPGHPRRARRLVPVELSRTCCRCRRRRCGGSLARLAPWRYRRIYGAFAGQDVLDDGPAIVARSGARYCALVEGADPA